MIACLFGCWLVTGDLDIAPFDVLTPCSRDTMQALASGSTAESEVNLSPVASAQWHLVD